MRRLRALPLLALLCAGAAGAHDPGAADAAPSSQVEGQSIAPPTPATPTPTPTPAPPELPIRVLAVEPARAKLGDTVTLTVQNLPALLARVDGDCTALVLFLADLPLAKTPPLRCDPDDGHVGFVLARNDDDDTAWHRLLGHPTALEREVSVTIGSSSTRSYPRAEAASLSLVGIPPARFVAFVLAAALTAGGVFWLGARTPMLRVPAGASTLGPLERPYSLSRAQQAFWVVLAVLAYKFVWLMTDELNSLTTSVLGLIGISAFTALASEVISSTKVQSLGLRLAKLRTDEGAADTRSADIADIQVALQQHRSRGFLVDVLSDVQGISLQRVQIALWTVVLGLIFVFEVYARLTMPDFDPTLLALMGISSGTYLAGKGAEDPVVPGSGA